MADIHPKFYSLPAEKQRRIVNAALEVFAKNDYRHASTDDMAAVAKISKGLLFHYFKNKQTLYLFCYEYAMNLVRGEILQRELAGITDFFELMDVGAQAKLALMKESPWLLDFSLRVYYAQDSAAAHAVQKKLDGDLGRTFSVYFKNIDWSKFRPEADPRQILRMLTWMTEGYLNELRRSGGPVELEAILRDYRQ